MKVFIQREPRLHPSTAELIKWVKFRNFLLISDKSLHMCSADQVGCSRAGEPFINQFDHVHSHKLGSPRLKIRLCQPRNVILILPGLESFTDIILYLYNFIRSRLPVSHQNWTLSECLIEILHVSLDGSYFFMKSNWTGGADHSEA